VVPGAGYHQHKVAAPRAVTPITLPSSTFLECYLADVILLHLLVETCMPVSMDLLLDDLVKTCKYVYALRPELQPRSVNVGDSCLLTLGFTVERMEWSRELATTNIR
jgi:hypothetical protein